MRAIARLPARRCSCWCRRFCATRRSSTRADRNKNMTALEPMKSCNCNNASFGLRPTKGPSLCAVPQMAKTDNNKVASVTPRGPNRKAAHRNKGTINLVSTYDGRGCGDGSPKVAMAEKDSNIQSSAVSTYLNLFCSNQLAGLVPQVKNRGANANAPIRSPSHQVDHRTPKSCQLAALPRQRMTLPIVALIIVQNSTVITKVKTSFARPNELWKLRRLSRIPAERASKVFPAAIDVAKPTGKGVSRFARKAPIRIPGQIR